MQLIVRVNKLQQVIRSWLKHSLTGQNLNKLFCILNEIVNDEEEEEKEENEFLNFKFSEREVWTSKLLVYHSLLCKFMYGFGRCWRGGVERCGIELNLFEHTNSRVLPSTSSLSFYQKTPLILKKTYIERLSKGKYV